MKPSRGVVWLLVIAMFMCSWSVASAAAQLSKLVLSKNEVTLQIGDTASLTAMAIYSDSTSVTVTLAADWTSDTPAVASVYNGTISAKKEGSAIIMAVYDGKSQAVHVTVTPKVKALTKDKQSLSLRKNETAEIVLTATYNDNKSENVSSKAEWTSADDNVATVVNGVVKGISAGSTTLQAKYGNQTVSVPVDVELVRRLDADKSKLSLLLKDKQSIQLIATYPDGTTADVAKLAEWSSSDEDVADALNGVITAYASGQATITAKYGTKTAKIAVDVDMSSKLDVDKQSLFLRVGGNRQLKLTSTYADGTTADVTDRADWTSSNSDVAFVSKGLITAYKAGAATIEGSYGGKKVQVTVDVEVPRFLELSQTAVSLRAKQSVDVKLTATYVDGTTEDVTAKATWKSGKEDVADVIKGRITAFASGDTTVTGSYGGKSASLTVDVDVPRKLVAGGKSFSLEVGKEHQITLLATFADGREELVTDQATWTTSSDDIAEVNKGLVTGVATGKATITAKYETRSVTISAEIGLAKSLTASQSLLILQPNELRQIVLTAESSSGDKKIVTADAEWSVGSSRVAEVDAGLVKATGNGSTTITAKYGGKTVTIQVEINVIDKLEADTRSLSMKSGDKKQIKLTATYSDGSKKEVSADAEWSTSSYKVADVSTSGIVEAAAYGNAKITAKYGNKSVTVPVEVDKLKYLQTDVVVVNVKAGSKATVKAIATFADGSEADISVAALWSSSKSSVADVKDGIIRAHAKGKATIMVSYGGKKAKVNVVVE